MEYIDNPFEVNQCVVCIKDTFPLIITTGDKERIGLIPPIHPRVGEVLSIDEILGEFIRFDEYDCHDQAHPDYGWRWWKHTHFKAATIEQTEDFYQSIAKKFMDSIGLSKCR